MHGSNLHTHGASECDLFRCPMVAARQSQGEAAQKQKAWERWLDIAKIVPVPADLDMTLRKVIRDVAWLLEREAEREKKDADARTSS